MSSVSPKDIEVLIDLFTSGGWKEISVATPTLSIHLSDDEPAAGPTSAAVPSASTSAPGQASAAPAASTTAPSTAEPSWQPVAAPNIGTFYRSPKPGAAPFVEVGDTVSADTEICLLEVMKLFTAVKAGVAGTIRAVVARDGEMVEGGQVLFHIEPQGS